MLSQGYTVFFTFIKKIKAPQIKQGKSDPMPYMKNNSTSDIHINAISREKMVLAPDTLSEN